MTHLSMRSIVARLFALTALLGLPMLAACEEEPEPASSRPVARPANAPEPTLEDWLRPRGQQPAAANPHGGAPHGGSPQAHEGSPHAEAPAAPAPGGGAVLGTISETMDSGGYTYMHVSTTDGPVWVACTAREVAVGSTVRARGMVMRDFRSSTLNRTFPQLVLASEVEITAAE